MAKVLVVDDEPVYGRSLKRLLSQDGHDVETAKSAGAAIEIGRCFRADVIIVDWMLGEDFNGLEVAKALRETSPDSKTIVITGYPSRTLHRQAERANVFAFFEKPFVPEELRDAVRRAIGAEVTKTGAQ